MEPYSVSVVIPTYNRSKQVLQAITSALDQSLRPNEIVVVDDGSTDDTEAAVATISPIVRYIRKTNGGVSSARNLGLCSATGDYVLFLDSDDSWGPEWIAEAINCLVQNPELGAVCANTEIVDEQGLTVELQDFSNLAPNGLIPIPILFSHRLGVGSNLCVRRKVLDAAGRFDEQLETGEDIDIVLRISAIAPIAHIPHLHIKITRTSQVESLSKKSNTGNRLRVLDKFEKSFPHLANQHRQALNSARHAIALNYAADLLWVRDFPAAERRISEAFGYKWTLQSAYFFLKCQLLKMISHPTRH